MNGSRIKTDGTRYVHNRTREVYLARHAGLMKIGHHGQREAWVECVMYQKAEKPSEWFARDLAAFCEQFTEERQLVIDAALTKVDRTGDMPHGRIENWFVMPGGKRLAGDITEHDISRKVGVDAMTSELLHIDKANKFAITENSIYELVGEEVTVG